VKVLIDTCVLSEIRKSQGDPAVKEAVQEISDDDLYLSVLTVGEIAKGIAILAVGAKRRALNTWLQGLKIQFAEKILPIDAETAQIWGYTTARLQQSGIILPAIDGLLAATALKHGMYLMTRNVRHFHEKHLCSIPGKVEQVINHQRLGPKNGRSSPAKRATGLKRMLTIIVSA
jgi:toxin FitB